jgi:kumamolisin
MKTPKLVAVCFVLIMLVSSLPHSAAAVTATGAVRLEEAPGAVLPLLSRSEKVSPMDGEQQISLTMVTSPSIQTTAKSTGLKTYLQGQGLTVTKSLLGGRVISVTGSVYAVENLLGVQLDLYNYAGQEFFANDRQAQLPAPMSGLVSSILGLDNALAFHPMVIKHLQTTSGGSGSQDGIPPYYTPQDIHTAYDYNPAYSAGLDGTGVTAAVVTFASFQTSDISKFFSGFNLSYKNSIQVVSVDGGASLNWAQGGSIESSMDVENLLSSAPGAQLLVYEGPGTHGGATSQAITDTLAQVVDDNRARVASLSWGEDDDALTQDFYSAVDTITQAGAAEGITFVGASGDGGGGNPAFPANDPYFTSVGGTSLEFDATGETINQETGWDDSGGGPSDIIPAPTWQDQLTSPPPSYRLAPDLAFDADPDPGYALYYDGQWNYVTEGGGDGGTSAAAPEVAAALVLADQALTQEGKSSLGCFNSTLYNLGEENSAALREITSGSNGPYNCSAGYNMVTGWGVPDVDKLIQVMAGNDVIPTMTGISPIAGPTAGGTSVTITGANLTGATAVAFGAVAATSFTVNSNTSITAISPTQSAGTVNVTVTTPAGASAISATDKFTYQTALPPIGNIESPTSNRTVSGAITVSGWYLDDSGVSNIQVLVDGALSGTATYGIFRPDVEAAYPAYNNANSGFTYSLNTTSLTNGARTITVKETRIGGGTSSLSVAVTVSNVTTSVTISVNGSVATATAFGITSPYYMFAYSQNGGAWQYGPYGVANSINLNNRGLAAGTWQVEAFALSSSDTNWGDGVWSAPSTITVSENVTVTANGTIVTAATTGVASPWYLFFYSPVGSTLTWNAPAFSQTNTYNFSSLAAGSYYVVGYALDGTDATDSPINWDAGIYSPYIIVSVGADLRSARAITVEKDQGKRQNAVYLENGQDVLTS